MRKNRARQSSRNPTLPTLFLHRCSAFSDHQIGSGPAFDLARYLNLIKLPFLFATGYDQAVIPDDLKMIVRLEKPFHSAELISAAARLYEATKGGGR